MVKLKAATEKDAIWSAIGTLGQRMDMLEDEFNEYLLRHKKKFFTLIDTNQNMVRQDKAKRGKAKQDKAMFY